MKSRRSVLKGLAASPLLLTAIGARADDVVEIEWNDLIPGGDGGVLLSQLRELGVVEHGQITTGFTQEEARAVTDEYNGKMVRLPGFVVPLEYDATGVKTFILAPFVGACIHVPPPPANQLVYVTSDRPYELDGLYDPVYVTGVFGIAPTSTYLASIGYAMTAEKIVPYT